MGTLPALDLSQQVMLDRGGFDRPIEGSRRKGCRVASPLAIDDAAVHDTLDPAATRPGVRMVAQEETSHANA